MNSNLINTYEIINNIDYKNFLNIYLLLNKIIIKYSSFKILKLYNCYLMF